MDNNKKFPFFNLATDEQYKILKDMHDDLVKNLEKELSIFHGWNFETELSKNKLGTRYNIIYKNNRKNPAISIRVSGEQFDKDDPKKEDVTIQATVYAGQKQTKRFRQTEEAVRYIIKVLNTKTVRQYETNIERSKV